jgi:hypothetical protein
MRVVRLIRRQAYSLVCMCVYFFFLTGFLSLLHERLFVMQKQNIPPSFSVSFSFVNQAGVLEALFLVFTFRFFIAFLFFLLFSSSPYVCGANLQCFFFLHLTPPFCFFLCFSFLVNVTSFVTFFFFLLALHLCALSPLPSSAFLQCLLYLLRVFGPTLSTCRRTFSFRQKKRKETRDSHTNALHDEGTTHTQRKTGCGVALLLFVCFFFFLFVRYCLL